MKMYIHIFRENWRLAVHKRLPSHFVSGMSASAVTLLQQRIKIYVYHMFYNFSDCRNKQPNRSLKSWCEKFAVCPFFFLFVSFWFPFVCHTIFIFGCYFFCVSHTGLFETDNFCDYCPHKRIVSDDWNEASSVYKNEARPWIPLHWNAKQTKKDAHTSVFYELLK